MSVNSVPITPRIVGKHFKELKARNAARALKMSQGVSGHGPNAAFRALRRGDQRGGGNVAGSGDSLRGVDLTDANVEYTASVGIGQPPTLYKLAVDTGKCHCQLSMTISP